MAAKGGGGRGGRIERLPSPLTLEQFDMGITLGTGSFGRVRFAVHKVRRAQLGGLVFFFSLFFSRPPHYFPPRVRVLPVILPSLHAWRAHVWTAYSWHLGHQDAEEG